jgi:hypothetical protein
LKSVTHGAIRPVHVKIDPFHRARLERQRFDDLGMFGEDPANLQRDFPIDVETRFHESQLGALTTRGADAELPRFIACGRHDATFAGASDGDRFAAQIRVVALFDGRVKRIHVDMNDLSLPCGQGAAPPMLSGSSIIPSDPIPYLR